MKKTKIVDVDGFYVKDVGAAAKEPNVFANLTYDKGFKIVLGTEGRSENLLKSLLNELLNERIVDLRYVPTEKLGRTAEEGESFLDVYCTDDRGRRFLIEMQMWSQSYYFMRALFYLTLAIQDQARIERKRQMEVEKKKWNYKFSPACVISFLNFPNDLVRSSENSVRRSPFMSRYTFKNEDNIELKDGSSLIFVDLERFRKSFDECSDGLEQWLYSIRNMHLLQERPSGIDGTDLEGLYREADLAAWPPQERSNYERIMGFKDDFLLHLQEQTEEAEKRGLEEGLAEGRAEGKAEAQRETAGNMLALGLDVQIIAQSTGLSVEEINALR